MQCRIFVTQPIAASALQRLHRFADVESDTQSIRILPKDELIAKARNCDILFCLLHDVVDREVMQSIPALRAVASMSITHDRVDVAEATARGIPVTVVPPIAVEATADLCWTLMMAVSRRVVEGDQFVRRGIFPGGQSNHLAGGYVWGKTLGLVGGTGRIARATARRARGFGMRILYTSRRRMEPGEEQELGATHVPLDDLLSESDFVSLHPAMTPETHHMIGAREFGFMKPTAYLINTSRGPVIDEAALAQALVEKRIAGAGLDVFEHEPVVTPGLIDLPNVVLTPHLGSAVMELREQMANIVVDNIEALLAGRTPPNCVNPETLGAWKDRPFRREPQGAGHL